jgi:hypothetical protein
MWILVLVGVLGTPVAGTAQTAEVVGTWQLDASRSDRHLFGERGAMAVSAVAAGRVAVPDDEVLVIAKTGDEVRVERGHRADGPVRISRLDGVARTVAGGGTLRGRVDQGATVLETVRSVTLPEGTVVETRTTERFSVQADGTLLHERRSEQGATVHTWRLVYRRVQ